MASYADIAARGPKQTNEEKMPAQVPEIAHDDSDIHSLDSMSSEHLQSVPSNSQASVHSSFPSYADQQLAAERAEKAEEAGKRAADKMAQQAKDFTAQAEAELQRLEKESGTKYSEFSQDAKESYEKWKKQASKEYEKVKKEASKDAKKAEKEAKKAGEWADKNKGNPVVVGNAVVIASLAGLLGIGAYRLHQRNELTWKIVGAWTAGLGFFAVADYYVSQYFFKQYPTKK